MGDVPTDLCDIANQIVTRFNNTRDDDLAVEIFRALVAERERSRREAYNWGYDDAAMGNERVDFAIRRGTA